MTKGLLIVLSGPSGVGKSTIYGELKLLLPNLMRSISVTTRAPRDYEIEGVHYYFKSVEDYQRMIARGEFLERAEVYCNYYGTPKQPVFDMLNDGKDVIFVVDTHGAKQIKRAYPEALLIFIFPPDMRELERRLCNRGTEGAEILQTRKNAAKRELEESSNYDYLVINDKAQHAARQIQYIIEAEKCAIKRNKDVVVQILKNL